MFPDCNSNDGDTQLPSKRCSNPECRKVYPLTAEHWHRNKNTRDGFTSRCKQCSCIQSVEYKAANPQKVKISRRRWKVENREHVKDYDRAYRKVNSETLNEKRRERLRSSPERQAKKKQADRVYAEKSAERLKAYRRAYYMANSDRIKARARLWRLRNTVRARATVRWYYENNKERWLNYNREQKKRNIQRYRTYRAAYRARKQAATGSHSAEEILELLDWQDGKCLYCGTNIREHWTEDHYLPLSSEIKDDSIYNIVLACARCNSSKQDKLPWLWDSRLL